MRVPYLSPIVCLCLATWALGGQAKTWNYIGDGRWEQTAAPSTQPVSDPTLDRMEQLLGARRPTEARRLGIEWIKSHKASPVRDRALMLLAEAFYQEDDRIKSFYYCDELMEVYPESPLFSRALARQYQIADEFLNGHKRWFLGMAILDAEDEAVEMLYRVQQRSPGSPLAERALLRTANYYYADTQYDLAADAYAMYVKGYPRSPEVPKARLRQAFANYAQFRGLKFDATPLIDARTQLADLVQAYPELAAQDNLPALIQHIDNMFARKVYLTADFYRRTHEPRAAVYTYRFLINTYPQAPETELARRELADMPAEALKGPAPAFSRGYAPTTVPSFTEAR